MSASDNSNSVLSHDENSKKMVEESGGALKLPSQQEIQSLHDSKSVYINKFMCAVLKNSMVKIGLAVENAPDTPATFVSSFICTVHDVASLQQLLTRLLTSYQQQQQAMIQAAQGKVRPEFLDTIKAMQGMEKEDAAATKAAHEKALKDKIEQLKKDAEEKVK